MATDEERKSALTVLSRQCYEEPATFRATVTPDPLGVDAATWCDLVFTCAEGILRIHTDILTGAGTIPACLLFPGIAVSGYGNFWIDRALYPEPEEAKSAKAAPASAQQWQTLDPIEHLRVKTLKELTSALADKLATKARPRSADPQWTAIVDSRATLAKE